MRELATSRIRASESLLACIFALSALGVDAASPALSLIMPRGAQRGTEIELTFHGARLGDTKDIFFYSPGFALKKLTSIEKGKVTALVAVDASCQLGEHAMRLRTASGITELRTFYVGALPSVSEAEPNSDFKKPQAIQLNVTVAGVVENEDVDYYVFEGKKGQRVTAEIEGMRLGETVFDPYVAILDSKRFELSASDDSALLRQDGVAQTTLPADGQYWVEVRESAYGGAGNCRYRVHIGTFPRPRALLPAGGKLGSEVEIKFLADVAGTLTKKVKLPDKLQPRYGVFYEENGEISPSANVFRLSEYENALEKEPNNQATEATLGEAPGAFNGVLSEPGDVDFFRFKAKKGQTFEVHLYGRRIRTPIDSVLRIYHFGGGQIAANDDSGGPDSYIRFKVPEDKEYALSIADHLGKGGVDYAYRVEITPVKPELRLSIPKVARYSQERQVIAVPRGRRFASIVNVSRRDFGGDVVLSAEDLPDGVSLLSEPIPGNLGSFPVVFEAKPDAAVGGKLARLLGRHADESTGIRGGLIQAIELSFGEPGQSVYWQRQIQQLAVAVTEEVPFDIRIVQPKVPLMQNGSMQLRVVAERKDGFKAPIRLQMLFNPPGVGSAGGVTIAEGKNEAAIAVNANGGAQIRTWKICVLGVAKVGNGDVWISTPFAKLEIARPHFTISMERSAAELGQQADFLCRVEQHSAFDGKAKVELLGLPHKVTTSPIEVDKETKEFQFRVSVSKESPVGNHKNIFCRVIQEVDGETIVYSTGGSELRVDKPIPPKKPKKNAPKKKESPKVAKKPELNKKAPPRPLTRLEKLRLEQKKRLEEDAEAGSGKQKS